MCNAITAIKIQEGETTVGRSSPRRIAGGDGAGRLDAMPSRHDALQRATLAAVLDGPGHTSAALRQAVALGQPPADLAGLVQRIRTEPSNITDADVDSRRGAYTEDQLFELIVAAAVGAANHRRAAALAALEGL